MGKVAREKRPATSKAGVRRPRVGAETEKRWREIADAVMTLVVARVFADGRIRGESFDGLVGIDLPDLLLQEFGEEFLRRNLMQRLHDGEALMVELSSKHDSGDDLLRTLTAAEAFWAARRGVDPLNPGDRHCIECGRWMQPALECPVGHCGGCHEDGECAIGEDACDCGHPQSYHVHTALNDLRDGACDKPGCSCAAFASAPVAREEVAA